MEFLGIVDSEGSGLHIYNEDHFNNDEFGKSFCTSIRGCTKMTSSVGGGRGGKVYQKMTEGGG